MAEKNNNEKNTRDITFPNQRIDEVNLEKEMEHAYIDYAMSVIVGRALPDVRDGLKPVHRRIVYTMYEAGLTSDKKHAKSVATVGDVLKKYHPHGDQSVYDALVRLAQDFSMRYPLVDGKGNFGSVDGDPPAAYRYTEARLAKISNELIGDIDKDTVEWTPNFDETIKEPVVIPTRYPNLLVNGSTGIAVGMTTNIPPHNLIEVVNGTICVLDNSEAELEDIMEHIKGPDFPTGGIIMGRSGIRQAYSTGRGHIRVRARTEMEEFGNGRVRIVVTELPYAVNKARLVENIADQYKEKRLEGISGLRDESDRNGMRIVIELKKDANPQVILNRLFAQTALQSTFAVVMLALVNNQTQPKILSLREVLDEYIAFQKEVVVRRTRYELKKAEERMHLVKGLLIATDNIDEVIRTIRSAYDDAKEQLMQKFSLSDVQAQAILEMQLRRLQGLEREKLEREHMELEAKIEHFNQILQSDEMVRDIIKEELIQVRDKYGDTRRTEIAMAEDDIEDEDLIEEEECVFTLTKAGYIKRVPASVYRAQNRGGRGIAAASLKEEDVVETVFSASTHDYILFFTNMGKVHRKKGYQIAESSRTAKGTNIVNVLPIEQDEKVTAMLHIREFEEDKYLFMITRRGTVKRITLDSIHTKRKAGIRCITLDEGDELIVVLPTDGEQKVILTSHNGMAICFQETDVRVMGRDALGVRGIRLKEEDYLVGADLAVDGLTLLSVTENGYGKRTKIEEYFRGDEVQHRGGSGLKNYNITEKTGKIAASRVVTEEQDVLMITNEGVIIRMAVADINTYSRTTQGVILMRLGDGVQVISATITDKEEPEEEVIDGETAEAVTAADDDKTEPEETESAPEE